MTAQERWDSLYGHLQGATHSADPERGAAFADVLRLMDQLAADVIP